MKALILAGGRGERLDDLSNECNKCMLQVNGKPVIEYSLECLVNTDIDEIIIIIGYRAEDIINHLGNQYKGKRIKYVMQADQKGLVYAIECAQDVIDGDDFMLLLGDEVLINARHGEMIVEFRNNDLFAICGVLWVDDKELIKKTYSMIQDENNNIFRLIEKPRRPLNNYMGTGVCIFKNQMLEYIEYTPIHHKRKEKELPDFIQCAIDDGNPVKSFIVCDKYANINTLEDKAMAEEFLKN